MYPKHRDKETGLVASPNFPAIEESVLAHWAEDDTFRASVEQRKATDAPEFVFYDGPPFANGLPHYGHLLTGYTKDLIPRFQTMRGKRVERRFGWDTHGLPAEVEAERLLGISGKPAIEEYGIGKFNAFCRTSVLKYTEDWRTYVTRQARWVDFDNDYKTLDRDYTESVIWAFKALFDKGLVYEGFKVLAYCWRCETPLSNHELRMDEEVYRSRQDQSVTVTFPVLAPGNPLDGVLVLAWTTTPWTLPTNSALAVGPKIDYAVVPAGPLAAKQFEAKDFLLAESRIEAYASDLGYADAAAAVAAKKQTLAGEALAGLRYERIFDFYSDSSKYETENSWQILVGEYVTADEGTGVVHQAPAYGEDDQLLCSAAGIPTHISIDEQGKFVHPVTDFLGMHVFEANKPITQQLKLLGRLLRQQSYDHSYPHCYRCKNPLIYKAVSSWFVETTRLRDRMLELNQQINWVPEHTRDGSFGKWLENVRDWAISRNRFWGAPIPVWKSDNPAFPRVDVYGSLDELERDFGVRPSDFHRPEIDQLTRPNPDDPSGNSTMRRVPEVLDCWFESGSMPFAQVHYPFENQDWFETHFPGDFIVEYVGQTRGWFYTLHVLSTALFDRPAFKSAISHGIVLGNDGQKMSKSLRNYPDVNEVFNRDGSDAMRWFLMASPILRGGNISVTEAGIREGVRQALLPLWNSYYFFGLYANAANYSASPSYRPAHPLDRYILAKTRQLILEVTDALEAFDSFRASALVRDFCEILTNWYIRRSRDRFWLEDHDAFDTLFTLLEATLRVSAPLLPIVSEEMWRGLTGGRSVHLEGWPDANEFAAEPELVQQMDLVREIASSALALRKAKGLRVRLPLARIQIAVAEPDSLRAHLDLLADELNVKTVELLEASDEDAQARGISRQLVLNARALGPRLGGKVQQLIAAAKRGEWTLTPDGLPTVADEVLAEGEFDLQLQVADSDGSLQVALIPGGYLLLDTEISEELEAEGMARDAIRLVQQARRDAGLDVSDRIELRITTNQSGHSALERHSELICAETLTVAMLLTQGEPSGDSRIGADIPIQISVTKA